MQNKLKLLIAFLLLIPTLVFAGFWSDIYSLFGGEAQLGASVVYPYQGGTGTSTTPSAGQVLIGVDQYSYKPAYLTEGSNITIATSSGGITISATGGAGGGITSLNGLSTSTQTFAVGGNGLTITSATGTHTFSLPQGLTTTSTPTFAGADFTSTTTFPGSGVWGANGNVGIGTTSPLALLDVNGNTILSGSNRYINFGSATSSNGYGIRDNSGNIEFKHEGGDWAAIGSGTGSGGYWTLSGSNIYPTSSVTQVGIGTTTPNTALHVIGTSTVSGNLSLGGNVTSGTWQGTAIGNQYGGTGVNTSGWSGLVTISSGTWGTTTDNTSNWDTAYSERGSQIAGTHLTWDGTELDVDDNLSSYTNDSGYLTSAITSLNGLSTSTQVFATSSATSTFGFSSADDTHTLTIPSNLGWFNNDSGFLTSSPFGASIDDTELTAEDFGDFTCDGGEDGCTLNDSYLTSESDPIWVASSTDWLSKSEWFATTTDILDEGSNNLYWTQARFDTAIQATTTDALSEGSNNLYWTQNRFDTAIQATTTSALSEGSNLYFTNERVDDRMNSTLVAGTDVSLVYDDGANSLTINATDTDTTYTASGTLLDLTGTTFSLNEGTLTDTKFCTYESGTGIVCNSDAGAGSGNMSTSTYDTDSDGLIDTTAGGTEADTSGWTGLLTISGGTWGTTTDNTSNWNTAYTERGSQIAGTHLTWNAGNNDLDVDDNLSVYTNDAGFITGNETITLTGDITGSGTTSISTSLTADSVSDNEIDYTNVTLNDLTFDVGSVSKTEYGYLNGVTSGIQGQIDSKLDATQNAWKLFYSNGSGAITELAIGSSGEYLKSAGASSIPTWDTPSGTSLWTDSGAFTYLDGTTDDLVLGGSSISTYSAWLDVGEDTFNLGDGGAGDSVLDLYASSTHIFTLGVDDSDSDKFKIGTSTDFSSGTLFSIDPSTGNVALPALTNCDTIDTDASGNLSCGTDDDVPESGDFGNAGDLDADGTLSTDAVQASEIDTVGAGRSLTWDTSNDEMDADSELYTSMASFNVRNATTSSAAHPAGCFKAPVAITITEVSGIQDNSTSSVQLEERPIASPYSSGTDILSSSMTLSTSNASTTSFSNAGIASGARVCLMIDVMNGNSTTTIEVDVKYTKDD